MPTRRAFLGLPALAHLDAAGRTGRLGLFLGGDVMTGRAIDQILPRPSDPRLREPFMKSALGYLRLAEGVSGPIPRPANFAYIWGDALRELARRKPDLRIVNLETSITTSEDWVPKGINYRMHPANVGCLTAAGLDCCVLANNHVLDFGPAGLLETLQTLDQAKIRTAGAGRNLEEAQAPAIFALGGKPRVLVFGFGTTSSGIPPEWAATAKRPGVNLLTDLSWATAKAAAARIASHRRPGDIVVVSIHWGGNWGYTIPRDHREFARCLIDQAGVDVIHGHSSHHPKGIEVYRDRPILYGCGDLLNDYEGIEGYEEYRSHLALAYWVALDAETRRLAGLQMTPFRIRRFRLERAGREDALWLAAMFKRESRTLGTSASLAPDSTLILRWQPT
jgi:poly-gamma-glutamate capsule biosynthesis protein CapA/YwtB (metallophosphatase superfamily)